MPSNHYNKFTERFIAHVISSLDMTSILQPDILCVVKNLALRETLQPFDSDLEKSKLFGLFSI